MKIRHATTSKLYALNNYQDLSEVAEEIIAVMEKLKTHQLSPSRKKNGQNNTLFSQSL